MSEMSTHINAGPNDIAETILLPGDPLRAQFIAKTYLENVTCYNKVRGMLGFTGTYKGKLVSVQGTGMGVPSISIYVNELIREYNVQNLIRIGTCGSMQSSIRVKDVILAQASCTDSSINRHIFGGYDFSPIASFDLLRKAYEQATLLNTNVHVGNIFCSDSFYRDDSSIVQKLMEYGVLAVEMETTALYTLAAKYGREALTILTASDHILTGEKTSAQEREQTFLHMIEIALCTL